jgi:hypothetical protein
MKGGSIGAPWRTAGAGLLPRRQTRDSIPRWCSTKASDAIVTLVYDKRTVGCSFARWTLRLLADDALAAVRPLQGRATLDPVRVGQWG